MKKFLGDSDDSDVSDLYSNSSEEEAGENASGLGEVGADGLNMGRAGNWMGEGVKAVVGAKAGPKSKAKGKWSLFSKMNNKKKAPPRPGTPAPALPVKQQPVADDSSSQSEVASLGGSRNKIEFSEEAAPNVGPEVKGGAGWVPANARKPPPDVAVPPPPAVTAAPVEDMYSDEPVKMEPPVAKSEAKTAPVEDMYFDEPVKKTAPKDDAYDFLPPKSAANESPPKHDIYKDDKGNEVKNEPPPKHDIYKDDKGNEVKNESPPKHDIYKDDKGNEVKNESPPKRDIYKDDKAVDADADGTHVAPEEQLIEAPKEKKKKKASRDGDEIEFSDDEDESEETAARNAAQSFESRKDQGAEAPSFDAKKGYAPRKLEDTKYWNEHDQYFRNDLKNHESGTPARTKYYGDEERAQHKLGVKDGLLTDAAGGLLDTQAAEAPMAMTAKAGRHIFAMGQEDDIYATDAIADNKRSEANAKNWDEGGRAGDSPHREYTHHSSFLEGKSLDRHGYYDQRQAEGVKGAGELAVKDGWLQKISNVSGHYMPDIKNTAATLNALDAKGVNTDATKVENLVKGGDGSLTTTEYMGRAVAATGGDTGLMDSHKDAFKQIQAGVPLEPTEKKEEADPWWKESFRNKEAD